jgi:hypothetical protein
VAPFWLVLVLQAESASAEAMNRRVERFIIELFPCCFANACSRG